MRKVTIKIVSIIFGIIILTTFLISLVVAIENYNNNKYMLQTLESTMRESYDSSIKQQVQNAISMLDGINKRYEKKEITLKQAKELGANSLRNLKYGDDGYFWADTEDGTNIVLNGTSVEGTNRMNTVDANGYHMVKDIIATGMKEGGGYTTYYFPKKEGKTPLPKRSYSLEFKPFGWIIGTGNYIDNIDNTIAAKKQILNNNLKVNFILLMIIIILLIVGACVFAINFIKKTILQHIDKQ